MGPAILDVRTGDVPTAPYLNFAAPARATSAEL